MDVEPRKEVDLGGMRVPYVIAESKRDFSIKNPLKLFDRWFNEARNNDGIREANSMAVATADSSGKPSVRILLLKSYSTDGFTFYTNYDSRKGREIAENPQVALLFFWEPLCRQVRIEGSVSKLSEKVSEEYFHSRPRSSQLSAVTSPQSQVIESKEVLVKKKEQLESEYDDDSKVIPKPNSWGGFVLKPNCIEFWCGRTDRLHDRIRFRQPSSGEVADEKLIYTGEDGWLYEYLAP